MINALFLVSNSDFWTNKMVFNLSLDSINDRLRTLFIILFVLKFEYILNMEN